MKRILCSLLLATLPFGSVLADPPKSKNAKGPVIVSGWLYARFGGAGFWAMALLP